MIILRKTLAAWGAEAFNDEFKAEVETISSSELPLQQGLSLSSYVSSEPFRVMVINTSEDSDVIKVKVGVFYSGIIAGCSCSDDPSPTDTQSEYCDLLFVIDKKTAETSVALLPG